MSMGLSKTERAKMKFPLLAVIFFALYGMGTVLTGLVTAVAEIMYYLTNNDMGIALVGVNMNFVSHSATIFLAIVLIVIALCRKKCGKMLAFAGAVLILSKLPLILFNVLKALWPYLLNHELANPIRWILYIDDLLAPMWVGCLTHLLLGMILIACAFKKTRDGLSSIWFFPVAMVAGAAVVVSTVNSYYDYQNFLVINNTSLFSILFRFVVDVVIFLLGSGVLILAVFFFMRWLKDPYKKETPVKELPLEAPDTQELPEEQPVVPETVVTAPEASVQETTVPTPAPVRTAPAHAPGENKEERGEKLRESLAEFKSLYEQGLITEEEFAEKKRQLLGL